MSQRHFPIVIVGGGTGGIAVAARLAEKMPGQEIALIEPSTTHYYQPLWTLVGGGVFPLEESARPEADQIPPDVVWVQDYVTHFEPEAKRVVLKSGEALSYDQLVVSVGMQLNWKQVEGLADAIGKNGVCSNYSPQYAPYTWEVVRNFSGGTALFTQPSTPIKCGGAPQKALYLTEDYFRKEGRRSRCKMVFASGLAAIFGVPKYRKALEKVVARKQIETHFRHELVAVKGEQKQATFRHLDSGEEVSMAYDMLHVVPPMSAPDFIRQSPLADAGGWVEVHKYTLQHTRYPDIFALGDCSSLPAARTGAAIRKQAPVLVENLLAYRDQRPLKAEYDGYSSCPLVTGYGSLILAEFDYDGQPAESFPFDQAQERFSMYMLKAYALPQMYWHGMMKGRM